MASVAPNVQAALGGALFADDHDDAVASEAPANVCPSHFGQGRVPREGVRPVFADPRDTEPSSRFLVRGGYEHQGTRRRIAVLGAAGDLAGHDGHRGGQVEHVDRAAPPHDVVLDLRAERFARPLALVDGHDVRVPEEGQRRAGAARIRALDRDHEGRATRVRGDAFDGYGQAREELLEEVGGALLSARIGGQVVDAAQAHQAPQQVNGLFAQRLRAHVLPFRAGASSRLPCLTPRYPHALTFTQPRHEGDYCNGACEQRTGRYKAQHWTEMLGET